MSARTTQITQCKNCDENNRPNPANVVNNTTETPPINHKSEDPTLDTLSSQFQDSLKLALEPKLFKTDLIRLNPPVAANRDHNACIIERLGSLCFSESLSDISFLVGKELVLIFGHKLVLSIGSQVFMAMFYGSGSLMKKEGESEIEIPDVEEEPFRNMMKYLYTDELCVEPDSVMSTLYVSKKYAIAALEQQCIDFLKDNLKPDNAFMLLQQARLFDESHLADLCLEVIDKYTNEALASDCFLEIDQLTLVSILERDTLGIRESELYKFVLKWSYAQCARNGLLPISYENQRKVLGDVLDYIRFSLMTREEFAVLISDESGRLIDNEAIIEIFIYLTFMGTMVSGNNLLKGQVDSNNGACANVKKLKYNDRQRRFMGGREEVVGRFGQVESRWGFSGTSDRIKFSVNRRIFVIGFGLYGSIYGKCEYQAIIQLIHFDSCTTCAQNTTTFTCDGTNSTFRVLFKAPVEITPDSDYIAQAHLKGPDSFYGTKGTRKVTHDKVTFQFQYANGNNNGTSVEDGQIPEILFIYSS